jgi:cytochrome P450
MAGDGLNSGSLAFGVVLLTIGYVLIKAVYIALTSPLKSVPGPWYSRFTNLWLKRAVTGGRRIYYIHEMHKAYGPVVRISPTEVAVSDPEGFKQIHSVSSKFTKDIWYEKLTMFPKPSVFTLRVPKEHSARRKLFARGFSKTYLRDNWESTVKAMAKMAVQGIKRDASSGHADILKWYTFMATDIVGRLGFGESFGMLELGQVSELAIFDC